MQLAKVGVLPLLLVCFALLARSAVCLSADEAIMLEVQASCNFGENWLASDGARVCTEVEFKANPEVSVKCTADKRITGINFGTTPKAPFSCLTPVLQRLTSLTSLRFEGPGLEGTLPAEWGALPNLQASLKELVILDHYLTGGLPAEWGNLQALTRLEVAGTDCCINTLDGPLPAAWGRLTNLQTLNLAYDQMTSTLPAEWAGMKALKTVNLALNHITGTIPAEWEQLASIKQLVLHANEDMCGPVPDTVSGKLVGYVGKTKC